MKKTKLTRSLLAACSIVALSAVMYGCVHDGDDPAPATDMGMEMPTTPEALACDAGASQACVDARQAELDAIEADDDATVGELNAAELALTDAQTALADANTAAAEEMTVSGLIDDAMTAIADIDDESTPAAVATGRAAIDAAQDSLDGMENLSADATAALQGRIDALESSFAPNEMAVAISAATAAAGTKSTAVGAEADQTGDAGLGGSDAPQTGTAGAYSMTIENDGTGATVKIELEDAADDDPKFVDQEAGLDGGRSMHVRAMEADEDGNVVEEVVIVSTDIEGPKATAFAMVHDLNANPETTGGGDFQSLDIAAGNLAMMMTDGITSTGSGEITLLAAVEDNDETDEDETVAAFETAATFDGAPGTLKCGGATDCRATLDAMGMITAVAGGWIFTPDADVRVDVDDADYLRYGFWLQRTTDADGAVTYDEVETFAGSSIEASGSVAQIRGSATYKGGAVGVYVREVYKAEDGSVDTATSGHFAAKANLTATFNQTVNDPDTTIDEADSIAPRLLNTLSGTINNFVLQHGEANDWAVDLQGDIDTSVGTANGTANGGGAEGSYSATFHGPTTDDAQPHTVVGEFNANFGNGTAAGGFGARKQD